LQEKVSLVVLSSVEPALAPTVSAADQLVGDVVSALLHLGYKRSEAERAVRAVRAQDNGALTLEMLLKDALQQLAR
jgi:Holliday junction resolvasome RuvABC DNA-binding subunit